MNDENLIPLNRRTEKQRKTISSKGGKASGEARRRKKALKDALSFMPVITQITDDRKGSGNGFVINDKLPSLNDYISSCRANKYNGAKLKADVETQISYAILQAKAMGTLRRPVPPIRVSFVWHEKTKRRDADNIASAKKFILDAMQKMGVIPNDSRKYVVGFTDEIVDDECDYVEVRIYEQPAESE